MANYTNKEKKELRDNLERLIKTSGISSNKYAAERLGVSGGTITNILNYWNTDGKVGDSVWTIVEKHVNQIGKCDGIATKNYKRVFDACDSAFYNKSAELVIGNGGYGKTYSLAKFKIAFERKMAGKVKVYHFNSAVAPKPKKFIAALMKELGCWQAGQMSAQLLELRRHFKENNCLLLIDEASALKGKDAVVIKDILDAAKDLTGVVVAGTPYFLENILAGKAANRHLFSELEDRFFSIPAILEAPTQAEAEAIFKLNGLSSEQIDIVSGRTKKAELKRFSWLSKPTFRGIDNCIQMILDINRKPTFEFAALQAV